MVTESSIVYGEGGFDPARDDKNIIDEWTQEREEPEEERADREFREAVSNANSVAALKDALLGTNITGRAESRPQS